MNQAIELLRNRAVQALDYFRGEQAITLQIDPIQEADESLSFMQKPLVANFKVNKHPSKEFRQIADGLTEGANGSINYQFDQLNMLPKSKKRVWIYNVSGSEYVIHGWLYKNLKVPACKDAEYAVVTSVPLIHCTPVPRYDTEFEMTYHIEDGRRLAQDLLNPESFGLDQNARSDPGRTTSVGTNYQDRGLFWSTHNPPLKSELRYAHKRLKNYYKNMLERRAASRGMEFAAVVTATENEYDLAEQYLQDSNGNK